MRVFTNEASKLKRKKKYMVISSSHCPEGLYQRYITEEV